MRRRGAIVVFAKAPWPGHVKTRMTPPLSPEQAAELYAALLGDVLAATAAFADELDLDPILAAHPASACRSFASAAPPRFRVVVQRGRDLAQRMSWAVREAAAAGAHRILLRGSDSPVLDAKIVGAALAALDSADIALCPDRDGGYNLVGLHRPAPGLFAHAMSSESVLRDTLAHAAALGLRAAVLDPSFDLDAIDDLRWLAAARRGDVTHLCPRTLAYLDEHDLWRHAPLF